MSETSQKAPPGSFQQLKELLIWVVGGLVLICFVWDKKEPGKLYEFTETLMGVRISGVFERRPSEETSLELRQLGYDENMTASIDLRTNETGFYEIGGKRISCTYEYKRDNGRKYVVRAGATEVTFTREGDDLIDPGGNRWIRQKN